MGKVREFMHLLELSCSELVMCKVSELRRNLEADETAHAAELEAKDKRIAELESQKKCAAGQAEFAVDKCMEHVKRIRELEAELLRVAQETVSLPSEVREYVEKMRRVTGTPGVDLCRSGRATLRWFDECFPTQEGVREMITKGYLLALEAAEQEKAREAEEQARNKRIRVLESAQEQNRRSADALAEKDKRIRDLEAELAKRELPPLPESVRKWMGDLRMWGVTVTPYERDMLAWVDTHYPAPVPQWELDARWLDSRGETGIAERIREAHRGAK